jgi:hypothetical protein
MTQGPQAAGTWLTRRRLKIHGFILALCLWSTYAWIMSGPGIRDRNGIVKGADFLHFYTIGALALEHRGDALYDMQAQSKIAQQRVAEAGPVYFVPLYPPQVSLLFAPFASLPYLWALLAWVACSALVYSTCCWALWRTCPTLVADSGIVFLLALAYPAFFHLIAWGQTSVLALACFTLAYLALRSGSMFATGLGIAAAVIFILTGQWKVVLGALTSGITQLLAGWAYYGEPVMRDFWQHLRNAPAVMVMFEPRPYQMHSLRAFWSLLVPWPRVALILWAASAAAVLIFALLCWKRGSSLGVRFSALLLATVLVCPHLTVYDLTILAPAFLLLADEALADPELGRKAGMLLYLCYVLPLIGPLAIWTHLQLSVPAMVALLWMIHQVSASTRQAVPTYPLARALST